MTSSASQFAMKIQYTPFKITAIESFTKTSTLVVRKAPPLLASWVLMWPKFYCCMARFDFMVLILFTMERKRTYYHDIASKINQKTQRGNLMSANENNIQNVSEFVFLGKMSIT